MIYNESKYKLYRINSTIGNVDNNLTTQEKVIEFNSINLTNVEVKKKIHTYETEWYDIPKPSGLTELSTPFYLYETQGYDFWNTITEVYDHFDYNVGVYQHLILRQLSFKLQLNVPSYFFPYLNIITTFSTNNTIKYFNSKTTGTDKSRSDYIIQNCNGVYYLLWDIWFDNSGGTPTMTYVIQAKTIIQIYNPFNVEVNTESK